MGRGGLPTVIAVCAALALCAAVAVAKPARPLPPTGGLWQSIPYKSESDTANAELASSARERTAPATAQPAPSATAPTATARTRRHPVPAAAVAEPAPRARAKELERRLDVLMPGTKLGEAMSDPENPAWRRARPGAPGGEHNTLSLPLDEKGHAGFLARGYHARPDVQNPHGNTGATFGLRTRF